MPGAVVRPCVLGDVGRDDATGVGGINGHGKDVDGVEGGRFDERKTESLPERIRYADGFVLEPHAGAGATMPGRAWINSSSQAWGYGMAEADYGCVV